MTSYITNTFLLACKWSIVQGRERHLVANTRDGEGPLYPSSAPFVEAVPMMGLYSDHIYPTSSLLLMLSAAMVMGYNCRAMTLHAECGFVQKAQYSSHKIMVRRRQVTAEIFENSTVTYGSSCDRVHCTPSAYELNRPLARKLKYVWNVGDVACGTWQFCLHNDEPCGFVTFLCVSVATHVTARGVRVITMKRRIRFGSVRG